MLSSLWWNQEQLKSPSTTVSFVGFSGSPPAGMADPTPKPMLNPLQEPVAILVDETLEAAMGAEGGLNGDLTVQGKFEVNSFIPTFMFVLVATRSTVSCLSIYFYCDNIISLI